MRDVKLISEIKNINKQSLLDNEYYCLKDKYDDDCVYIKRKCIYKYNNHPVLFGEFKIRYPSGDVVCEITDQNGQLYAPFYNPGCHLAHREFLNKLKKVLNAEIKNLDTKPRKRRTVRKS